MEIKAGPELDRAVAEAVGWIIGPPGTGFKDDWRDSRGRTWPISEFKPSTDLNAAFAAAEKVMESSFSVDWHESYGLSARTGWCAEFNGHNFSDFAPTAALSICAAILRLRETVDGN